MYFLIVVLLMGLEFERFNICLQAIQAGILTVG